MTKKKIDLKQKALAKIKDLTLSDALRFFSDRASDRDKKIADMVELGENGEFENDNPLISEGDDNGAYVMGWRWVSFEGTEFNKVCSACDCEGAELRPIEMRDGTTETLCPVCLEEITCPGEDCGAVEGTKKWGTVGDGFDGYCPSCADKREANGEVETG